MTTLAWGSKIDAPSRARVLRMCRDTLHIEPSWLMACMWFESRLNPAAVNPTSGASGLIQFMPKTAIGLGTTVEQIRNMTTAQQLELVERYFVENGYAGRMRTFSDTYAAILYPAAIGLPDQAVIFQAPSQAYQQNRALDVDNDGKVTKAEATAFVQRALNEGLQPGVATEERELRPEAGPPPTGDRMGALAALQLFGPILQGLIPQIANILKPESQVAKRNVALAETIVNTITSTAQAPNLQAAVEKMQADPAVKDAVQKAVVTEPTIMQVLQIVEVGGGAAGAAERDLKVSQADKPFWYSPVFWISLAMLPMIYWFVGSVVAGGVPIPEDWPWIAQMPFKLLGTAWNGESRSGIANLVIGLVLGGICGVYYGISVTQRTQDKPTTQQGGGTP